MNMAQSKLTLSQRKRLDILAAARSEYLEAGFRDTSMDRIAERAQVSKRTVYNHFPSKEALFKAIATQFMVDLRQAISVAYDPAKPLEDQLTEIARREVEQVTQPDHIGMFRVFFTEVSNFSDAFDDIIEETYRGEDPLENWIDAAVADGRLSVEDSALAAAMFNSLLKGALFWPQIAGYAKKRSKREKEAVISEAVHMFLAHYGRQR
ncbi:MAG: TetR/AcrR family transcriptional regulator [Pseudomonadota bacterium]